MGPLNYKELRFYMFQNIENLPFLLIKGALWNSTLQKVQMAPS